MTPPDFIQTIYLGDRGCKGIYLEAWRERVVMHVDVISRVRGPTWDFYTAEDIPDGRIVFTGVKSIRFEPSGPLPNDFINGLSVSSESGGLVFRIEVGSVAEDGASTEVVVTVLAGGIHLEDPRRPGEMLSE